MRPSWLLLEGLKMTTIEYLSYSKPKRMAIRFASFLLEFQKRFKNLETTLFIISMSLEKSYNTF